MHCEAAPPALHFARRRRLRRAAACRLAKSKSAVDAAQNRVSGKNSLPTAKLLSIATAVPPHTISQSDAKSAAKAMFRGRAALFDRLSGVFDNALIDRRSTVAPIDWYREPHGWQERTELYVSATEALFEEAATRAIANAGLTADESRVVSSRPPASPHQHRRPCRAPRAFADLRLVPMFAWLQAVSQASPPGSLAAAELEKLLSSRSRLIDRDPLDSAIGGDRCDCVVRRRGGGGGALDEVRCATFRGAGEKLWPDKLGSGMEGRGPGLAVIFVAISLCEGSGSRRDTILPISPHPSRHRPLLLPPRRDQGGRRDRDRARAPDRHARSGTRCFA